jgi:hypothetical protein
MATIHIWDRSTRSAAGHASMQCGSLYLTWWPTVSLVSPAELPDRDRSFQSIPFRKFEDDQREEGRSPDVSVEVRGLDESRIANWWRRQTNSRHADSVWDDAIRPWTEFGWNSVRLIATCLDVGSASATARPKTFLERIEEIEGRSPIWTAVALRNYIRRFSVSHRSVAIN